MRILSYVLVLQVALATLATAQLPQVRLSWSPTEVLTDVPCLPEDGTLYVVLSGFPTGGMRGLKLDATTYRDDPGGLHVIESGPNSIPGVAWTEAIPEAQWGEHDARLRINTDHEVIAVHLTQPIECRPASIVVSYAVLDIGTNIALADVAAARATIQGGADVVPRPAHLVAFEPTSIRAAEATEIEVIGANLEFVTRVTFVQEPTSTVDGQIILQEPGRLLVRFSPGLNGTGLWRIRLHYGRGESHVSRAPVTVLPAQASPWPVGSRIWCAEGGTVTQSHFIQADPFPAETVSFGSHVFAVSSTGQFASDLRSVSPQYSERNASSFSTPHGLLVAQGSELTLWDSQGAQRIWQQEIPLHKLDYSHAESILLSCGSTGGHGVVSGIQTHVVGVESGSVGTIEPGAVRDGVALNQGIALVKVDAQRLGRGTESENTLESYTVDGHLRWTTPIGCGYLHRIEHYETGHIFVLMEVREGNSSTHFRASIFAEQTGAELFQYDLDPARTTSACLTHDARKLILVQEHRPANVPCVSVSTVDVASGMREWTRQVDCVDEWESEGGEGFGVYGVGSGSVTGLIAFLTSRTRSSGFPVSEFFLLDPMGNQLAHDILESGDGNYDDVSFLQQDRFIFVHHPSMPCVYVAR